ncbi:ABC transporter ATP-binding protein [Verrucomicrobiaceae bacterium R5-34]|uniref:ABC transporter ATP-binding protein n=1 Tax=Oceaniferula flava TaxID=2800421 RepID=A0AAE2SA88_9BACT|nr:ABC transporter ATP-binding protein [Oceaniferula flavus]MBK1831415.1 ABC transporter ATP-binding protein [Verrucomicrobiaceae bacterium R5-34]MBK1854345.1 ABC transporter ATP-binding protein [Oceaniferula flavus]MBM1135651.1 ABC transporter ATP-binding protein [Oceaniferula flavus]
MKRFLPYYKYLLRVRWHFIAALIAGAIFGAASGAGLPWMMKKVLPEVFGRGDEVPLMELLMVALIMPAVFFVRGLSQFINNYLIQYCGLRVLEFIQVDVFSRLQKLPLKFFQKHKSGDLLSRLMGDTQMMRMALVEISNDIIIQPMQMLGALGFLIYMSSQKSEFFFLYICLATIPLCVMPIQLIGKKLFKKAKSVQEQTGDLTASVTDGLQAPMEIRSYNMQGGIVSTFQNQVIRLFKARMKVVKYDKMLGPTIEFVSACGVAVAIVYAGRAGLDFESDMMPLLMALYMCYDPIKRLGKIHTKIQRGNASLDRIEYLLHYEDELPEAEKPVPFENVSGRIRFENIQFAYEDQLALDGVDLEIPSGQVVALVGPSGAGKSTFASLIPRFYDVNEGCVYVDGHDVRAVRKSDLRSAIAVVSQQPVLFNATVLENIRIGNPEASDLEVIEAAKKAHAHDFIEKTLDDSYQTMVGEKGTRLSGGQRQRIAIARAFLKNAPILILDEATSALDSESEAKIQQALEELVKGRTTFIIAHRFSTIKIADRILVFDQGKIVADGAHAEIYDSSGLYRDLYDRQSG